MEILVMGTVLRATFMRGQQICEIRDYIRSDRVVSYFLNQKHTPRVAAGIADQWIAWYDDVDNKMLMCLADVYIIVACTSGF